MKRLISFFMAAVMLVNICVVVVFADSDGNGGDNVKQPAISKLDVFVAASAVLNADVQDEDLLVSGSSLVGVIPLYNPSGDTVIAWYAYFSPTGYAVINNNANNPAPIEFGEGRQSLIDEIIADGDYGHIVYNTPIDVHEYSPVAMFSASAAAGQSGVDMYDVYPDLKEDNAAASNQLSEMKAKLLTEYPSLARMRGDGDYGFIDAGNMPSGGFTASTILGASSVSWAKMGDFNSIAQNHCAATLVTNLALYFASRGKTNLKKNNSNLDTFVAVHKIVPNGPVLAITSKAVKYFSDCGYTLNYGNESVNVDSFVAGIKADRPMAVLLEDGVLSWHWVLGVGYRDYANSNGLYLRIVNGWVSNANVYYKPYVGSAFNSSTPYWVS